MYNGPYMIYRNTPITEQLMTNGVRPIVNCWYSYVVFPIGSLVVDCYGHWLPNKADNIN